jgi:C4-dicarboxylate-specific signal transduction histidine kinase
MANPACVKLYRAESEQTLLGRDVWSMTSPASHPLLQQRIKDALKRGEENPVAEVDILCLDGTTLCVEGVSLPIDYLGRRAIHVMMYDATHRKLAEALQRQHREEMEQMHTIQVAQQTVAGIAHELNQPLNALTTLAEAALQESQGGRPVSPQLADTLESITQSAQRAGRVVHELMAFMRKPGIAHGAVEIGMLVHEAVAQCESSQLFAGEIKLRLPSVLPRVTGNALQIETIVSNLLRNAVEACLSSGSTGRASRIVIEAYVDGQHVCLLVEDNGPGVAAALRPRLFQPFASNKPGGIGMGLSISHSLARSLGGALDHEPVPGGGARFRLMLPIFDESSGEISA